METYVKFPLLNAQTEIANMEICGKQKVTKGGWRSAIYLIGVEVAERFTYYWTTGNLINYLTNVLGESTATAAKNINVWSGIGHLLPLLGAFVADSYLGRFNTILISTLIYIMGLGMLMLSVSVVPLRFQHVLFFVSLYLVAIGVGGHKPCVQAFGADQFNEDKPEEKKAKSSFFNWWYFGIVSGATTGMLIAFYVQDNVSWMVGFGIPALAMAFALVLYLLGWQSYRRQVPKGSPLVGVIQVFVAACCKRHLCVSKDGHTVCREDEMTSKGRNLAQTHQFKFLDKATIVDEIDALRDTKNNWRLCSITQVEEVKLLIRLVPIWLSCLMYAVIQAQGSTFFTKQGSSMDRLIGHNFFIPPASLQAITGLTMIITVPIYDRIFVPIARNWTGHRSGITMLQRIGAGMLFSILSMIAAALVEAKRVQIATKQGLIDHPEITVPMSVWWLLPQYILAAFQDVFTMVGMQELFYDQMPDTMRSIGSATYLSVLGVGSLLSSIIISVVQFVSFRAGDEWLGNNLNRAHLDYYYWLLAGLSTLWLGVYVCVSKRYLYKKIDHCDAFT